MPLNGSLALGQQPVAFCYHRGKLTLRSVRVTLQGKSGNQTGAFFQGPTRMRLVHIRWYTHHVQQLLKETTNKLTATRKKVNTL